MRHFLKLLELGEGRAYPAAYLGELVGVETYVALQRAGVLLSAAGDRLNQRARNDMRGWAGNQPSDTDFVTVSRLAFAKLVQRQLGLTHTTNLSGQLNLGSLVLGVGNWAGTERAVYLLWSPTALEPFLVFRNRSHRCSTVILPTRRGVIAQLRKRHAPGSKVELVFLEDILIVVNGQLISSLKQGDLEELDTMRLSRPRYRIVDRRGSRYITRNNLRRVVSRAAQYDLWIDMTNSICSGRFRAGRRPPNGEFERVALPNNHAAAVAELAERRRALRPRDLKSIDLNCAERIIQRARQAVDVRLSRYSWRSIHTIRDGAQSAKRYLFNPPQDMEFAIVKPATTNRNGGSNV